jgi:hypothetical protein
MKHVLVLLVAAMSPSADLSGQNTRWRVTTELQAGMFLPTRDLGTDGVTRARNRQAPTISATLRFRRTGAALGLYLGTTQALRGGFRAWPTAECQIRCEDQTVHHGRFWTFTGGATFNWRMGPIQAGGLIGGGLRTYSLSGPDVVASVPQPGEFWTGRFLGPNLNLAFHAGLQLGRQIGEHLVYLRIEDYVAGSSYERTFNDLVLGFGIHMHWQ